MQRINFYNIFKINTDDGSIEPIRMVQIGGITFGPGVRFGRGVSFSGIDLHMYIGRDFQVREENHILVILGIYA